jgi:CubicO group peptidase (beta-lactamase class C family)
MKRCLFCSFAGALYLLPPPSFGQTQKIPQQLDALVAAYAKAGQFNGTVLVAQHGKVIFTKGYGLANREWNQPNAADTKFRIGSLTKQFTAMLVMQLVEKGRLRLDGPVSDYLPNYPKPNGDKITLHHLLSHTSGIPNFAASAARETASLLPTTPQAAVRDFSALPLEFEPGSTYRYSNSGYILLGAIIEQVTNKPYAQVLAENILQPLHMQDTGYDLPGTVLPKRAAGYEKTATGVVNTAYLDMTGPYAAGSMYSTVDDLYKWDQALYTTQLLSETGKAQMFQPFKNDHAYGWNTARFLMGADSVAVLRHGGVINGFRAFLLRVPKDHHLVVALDNESNDYTPKISTMLLRVLYQQPTVGPEPEPLPPKP